MQVQRATIGFLLLLTVSSCRLAPAPTHSPARGGDEAVRLLLTEIRGRQPVPYGLPDRSPYNYIWAQYAMSFLAAERCGYMNRTEAVARLQGLLNATEKLERHHGFWFDEYDLDTGRRKGDKIYFQGWWLYGLCILKNAYPELSAQCERLLGGMDYEHSGLFNAKTRQLAADYFTDRHGVSFWIDLYWQPTGEFRTPYVAYSYITGDISPWTRWATPRVVDLEGQSVLGVWHNFYFCAMLVHSVFPDLGYLERSWNELLQGLEKYRIRNGMEFYPTRAESLEEWVTVDSNNWPNTEHRIAKPWLAWFIRPDAPVMEKAFTPGHGISLYSDNVNFYWSYGDQTNLFDSVIGTDSGSERISGRLSLPFMVFPLPSRFQVAHPPQLTAVQLIVSCAQGDQRPHAPLEVSLDGTPLAWIQPEELTDLPQRIVRSLQGITLTNSNHTIELSTREERPGCGYRLYAREHSLWPSQFRYRDRAGNRKEEKIDSPYVEVNVTGQYDGGENPYALLARCAVVHGYYVWHEMLNDERFYDTTVAWVGDYYDRVQIAQIVHNVSDQPVRVRYRRPEAWSVAEAISVRDITGGGNESIACVAGQDEITWPAAPRRTYRIRYSPKP